VKALVTQKIDWIDQAPIHIQGTGSSSASPDAVFAVLADHERWPEWFPNVKKVEIIGPASGVGARRRVHVPGMVVEEEFIVWEPGERWSFTGTAAKPAAFRSLIEDCQLTARPDGGTDMSYTMHIGASALLRPLIKAGAGTLRKSISQAMANLGQRAAAG
jgi:hypothetical protein